MSGGSMARRGAPLFGSHLSIAGGMTNALSAGEALGLDTVQVFTKNQQQWKVKPLDPGSDVAGDRVRIGTGEGAERQARGQDVGRRLHLAGDLRDTLHRRRGLGEGVEEDGQPVGPRHHVRAALLTQDRFAHTTASPESRTILRA